MPARRSSIVPAVLASLVLASPAQAFDWNGKTVTQLVDLWDGRFEIRSGHPLATYRAFQLAAQDPDALAAMHRVYDDDLTSERSDAIQTVLFGGWLNEVNTNIDMGGSKPLEFAANYLAWRFRHYLDGREHSDRWQKDTGWTSSNYLHSMVVTSIDQASELGPD